MPIQTATKIVLFWGYILKTTMKHAFTYNPGGCKQDLFPGGLPRCGFNVDGIYMYRALTNDGRDCVVKFFVAVHVDGEETEE